MQVSSISSATSTPSQVQEVRPGDGDAGDTSATRAAASPPPVKSNDGDGDDGGSAASTALTRSSASVQDALLNLQTGG